MTGVNCASIRNFRKNQPFIGEKWDKNGFKIRNLRQKFVEVHKNGTFISAFDEIGIKKFGKNIDI